MATNFPTSLDALTNPASSDSLSSPSHSSQHANVNDAVEALQAKVGVDGSAVTSSHDYKLANIGTWQDFPGGTGFANITVGNGDLTQRYCVINDVVLFVASFELGSTSALTSGVFQMPVTMSTLDYGSSFTSGIIDGTTQYGSFVRHNTTTQVVIRAASIGATYVQAAVLSATVPFTWGVGDRIAIQGIYEKA
jgi:hypothetical protein